MPAKKQRSERNVKPSKRVVGRSLRPIVGTPRSDEACADADVWASRNPKGRVVPYRLAARMERELADALDVLNTIADPRVELHQDGRSIDRTYEDIALECLTRIRGSNPTGQATATKEEKR